MAKRGGFPGAMPGNMSNLMKQAQKMQRQMEESQKEMEQATFQASVGGGAVEVTVSGKKDNLPLPFHKHFEKGFCKKPLPA